MGWRNACICCGGMPLALSVAMPTPAEPRVVMVFRSFITIEPPEIDTWL